MPTIKDVLEQRANVWEQAQEVIAVANARPEAERAFTPEEDTKFSAAMADVDRLQRQADELKEFERLNKPDDSGSTLLRSVGNGSPTGTDPKAEKEEQHRSAFDAYVRYGKSGMESAELVTMREYFTDAKSQRAQGTNIGTAGGFTVPQGFWAKVTETMKWYASVAEISETIETDTGQNIPWPSNDDTANAGHILGENATDSTLDLTFGQRELAAWMYTSDIILVSIQMMQDAGIDISSFVAKKAGQRLGRIVNQHLTTGTGAGQPQGFVTGATVGKTSASATTPTYAEFVDLLHSLDPAYRNGATWAFHDLTLAFLRKMVDGQSRPLWQPSIANGVPDTFMGYAYEVNNFMAQLATTNKTVAFGNFKDGYVTRNVRQPQLLRLEERYADALQVGFILFSRYDGMVQDSSAIKLLQMA